VTHSVGDDAPPVDPELGRTLYAPLTDSVRRLVDAAIRSDVDRETISAARELIDSATELLAARVVPGSFGVRRTIDGGTVAWGNAAIGLRNAIAPPLVIHHDAQRVCTDVELGAAYEGPPGHVHGGVCALILDHLLGATAHQPGKPAFTGTITIKYLRPTKLGRLHAEAHVDREEDSKTFAVGHISDTEGITVQAEGVFIRPKGK
jgi:acyl-coenzyme A thioesterase PaaI-like protein